MHGVLYDEIYRLYYLSCCFTWLLHEAKANMQITRGVEDREQQANLRCSGCTSLELLKYFHWVLNIYMCEIGVHRRCLVPVSLSNVVVVVVIVVCKSWRNAVVQTTKTIFRLAKPTVNLRDYVDFESVETWNSCLHIFRNVGLGMPNVLRNADFVFFSLLLVVCVCVCHALRLFRSRDQRDVQIAEYSIF